MSTSMIAMGVAITVILGFIVTLALLSFLSGTVNFFVGKPKLIFLKSEEKENGFAFGFKWNAAKEPVKIDFLKIRLFNPFGSPTQAEVARKFSVQTNSFAEDIDMGPGFKSIIGAQGFERARIMIEVGSSRDGVSFQFEMKGDKFRDRLSSADQTVESFIKKHKLDQKKKSGPPVKAPERSFIADTSIPGSSAQVKIATNPFYAQEFAAHQQAAGGGEAKADVPNFAITKVWIEPGCIVCNACEDIYPEVFDVQADTCYIKPEPPLDDGLRIEEAAEACPVEVIKFTKA